MKERQGTKEDRETQGKAMSLEEYYAQILKDINKLRQEANK